MRYIIWNPAGRTPPTVQFDSRIEAENEAERLAKHNLGSHFYVCQLISLASAVAVSTTRLDGEKP